MHGNAEQTVHQMIVGMIVGYLFFKTGNLWIGIIVHFFNNFISVTQAYIISNIPSEASAETAAATGGTAWISLLISLVVALAFAYFGLYLFKMLSKKVIEESNRLNGEVLPENLAEISIDGKPEYVEMTVEGGQITNVAVVESKESAHVTDVAIARIPAQMVEFQTTEVDVVTGATLTSNALMRAAAAAAETNNTAKAVKKINSNVEKTTLGDIDALAALKSQLENK